MASLIDLNRQIAKLQKQADAIKNRERKSVIAQIRQAIADYELTAEDLFSPNGAPRRGRKRAARTPRRVAVAVRSARCRASPCPSATATTKATPGPAGASSPTGCAPIWKPATASTSFVSTKKADHAL